MKINICSLRLNTYRINAFFDDFLQSISRGHKSEETKILDKLSTVFYTNVYCRCFTM